MSERNWNKYITSARASSLRSPRKKKVKTKVFKVEKRIKRLIISLPGKQNP